VRQTRDLLRSGKIRQHTELWASPSLAVFDDLFGMSLLTVKGLARCIKVYVFCRLGTTAHYTLIIAYSVVIALGFLGNIAIIVAFLANKVRQEYQAKKGQTVDVQ
jgi:hypothetical protein